MIFNGLVFRPPLPRLNYEQLAAVLLIIFGRKVHSGKTAEAVIVNAATTIHPKWFPQWQK